MSTLFPSSWPRALRYAAAALLAGAVGISLGVGGSLAFSAQVDHKEPGSHVDQAPRDRANPAPADHYLDDRIPIQVDGPNPVARKILDRQLYTS